MKLSTPRYSLCLFFQLSLLLCDLLFNCVSLFPKSRDGLLVLFIFQDLFLVLSITSMLMTFFSTYLFQMGRTKAMKRQKGNHTNANMLKAIQLCRGGMSLRKAAEETHVQYFTLFRYVKKVT